MKVIKLIKDRGFARKQARHSHHSIRNQNRGCEEDSFQPFDCKVPHKLNTHWACQYVGPVGNVPNMSHKLIDEELYHGSSWREGSLRVNILDKFIESEFKDNYLRASLKQLERRGSLGIFKGHR